MAVCPLCHSRKGKRACPALRTAICSVCCGEKRLVEIACPQDCTWLSQGTRNDMRREASDYLRHQDPQKAMRWLRTVEGLGFLLETIERAIAASSARSLEDSDLLLALTSARKTFESESKGIIYEDLPTAPSLQVLSRAITDSVRLFAKEYAQAREKAGPQMAGALPDWGPAEAAHCLEVLAERCEFHIARGAEVGSFVAYLHRVHPPSARDAADDGPRIVLT